MLKKFINKIDICMILLASIFVTLFSFASSPIYSMVYASYNQSIFYLAGKMMKSGKVMYKDIFDSKGIYVFLIHYISELLCENRHIGLFLISVMVIFITSYIIYKIFSNLCKNKILAIISAVSIICYESMYYFSYGGLQCETIILPIIYISIYICINDIISDMNGRSYNHTLLYGIIFGIVFFIKANYCVIFLGIAIFIFIDLIKRKYLVGILFHFIFGIIGIGIGILPGMLYCIINNCVNEMIDAAFVFNMIYSHTPYTGLNTIHESLIYTLDTYKYNIIFSFVSIFAFIYITRFSFDIKRNIKLILFYVSIVLLTIFSVLYSCRPYEYYQIMLLPFWGVDVLAICIIISKLIDKLVKIEKMKRVISGILLIVIFILHTLAVYNFSYLVLVKHGKENELVADGIKTIYNNRDFSINDNEEIFVLGVGLYIYEELNKLPNFKFYCMPVIESKYWEQPYQDTYKYIMDGRPSFLVLDFNSVSGKYFSNANFNEVLNQKYKYAGSVYSRAVFFRK